MTAKEYLGQIRKQDIKIGQRITQLNRMRERITFMPGIDYSKDRIQTTASSGNKTVEALVDKENQVIKMIEKEQELKDRIITEIQTLEDPVHVDILFRRYVECQSFVRIANDMNYTYHWLCKLHGDALKEFTVTVMDKQRNKT